MNREEKWLVTDLNLSWKYVAGLHVIVNLSHSYMHVHVG